KEKFEWIEGTIIIAAVLIIILVTALNNWIRERQFRDLQSRTELNTTFNVIRDSTVRQIPIKCIVVGDICEIKYGDLLPVDGVVIQSNNLKVDESSLTGESDLIKKHESSDPFLLSGTRIMEGSGKMLVLAVGEHTQTGEHQLSYKYWSKVIRYFITFITVYVVAVPESLPLTVTQSLEYAVKKMMKDNNTFRNFHACETMGNVTALCFDKTGVLTTNDMTVVQVYAAEKYWKTLEKSVEAKEIIIPANTKDSIFECLSVNCSYSSKLLSSPENETRPKQIGNNTECALLGFVGALNGNYDEIRRHYPEEEFVHVYPFNSMRKYMSTVIRRPDSTVRMYTKGASEIVLKICKTILNCNGEKVPFSIVDYDRLVQTVIEPMAYDGLRTVCLAYRDFSPDELPDWNDEASVMEQLTCICMCGIENPVRLEVPDVIAKCRKAGITVQIFTGDNVNTTRQIALKCGIISSDVRFLVLEGKEFNRRIRSEPNGQVEQNLFDKVWPHLRILARASPQDKYVLVKGIMKSKINPTGEVVAVVGDGTNDGAALKKADVGLVMVSVVSIIYTGGEN
ncbi:unnamed protein product, partial [Rotaria sp. Silwood2]